MAEQQTPGADKATRLVWDLPLRLFHWTLAISIGLLWLTQHYGFNDLFGLPMMQLHIWLGYFVLGLIIFRLIWGFVGPRHARFTSFFPLPLSLWRYVRAMAFGTESKAVGHNPLGSLMVFLMLFLVGLQGVSGLYTNDDIAWYGPYAGASGDLPGQMGSIHRSNFDYILIAIGLHIAAILFYWIAKKQNLVGPMLTGRKSADYVPETEAITSSQLIRAGVVALVAILIVAAILAAAPPPPASDFDFM